MKKTLICFCFIAAMIVFCALALAQNKGGGFSGAPAVQGEWYANSYALVVGINSYSHGWGRLSAGVNDAKKMATALRARGFQVDELYDREATSSAIIAALRKAAMRTTKNDGFVFYYSGHGFTKTSEWDQTQAGYLVPVDGRSGDISNYLAVTQIRDEILTNCKAKHVLLIVDSCFSGTLLTRSGVSDGAVADYLGKRGIFGITAGMQDQAAVDGLFASVLLDGLNGNADFNNDGFVAFKELGMYAEQNVKSRNHRQTPDYGVMYGEGQFVFAKAGGGSIYTPDVSSNQAALEAKKAALIEQKAEKERIAAEREQLAYERRKLEKERKRFETQKTITAMPPNSSGSSMRIVRTSGQYAITACDTILDTKTNLEWGPNSGRAMNWEEANDYAKGLTVCGHSDWRLPTISELVSLFDKSITTEIHLDPIFKFGTCCAWSSELLNSSTVRTFNFGDGFTDAWNKRSYKGNLWAFPVRSRSGSGRIQIK